MSSIIQPVSYREEDAKNLIQKLSEHLGIHKLTIYVCGGEVLEGIISEIGKDYIAVLDQGNNMEMLIPLEKIIYVSYLV